MENGVRSNIAKTAKILVTNITSDELVQMCPGISLHHIVCDHTVEVSGSVRKQAFMICSHAEYESIMTHGYYEIEDADDYLYNINLKG